MVAGPDVSVLEIGSRLELFVDEFLVAALRGGPATAP